MSNRRAPVECDPWLPPGTSLGTSRLNRRRHFWRAVVVALFCATVSTLFLL